MSISSYVTLAGLVSLTLSSSNFHQGHAPSLHIISRLEIHPIVNYD